MTSIKNIEKIIALDPTWAISDFVFIKSLEWTNDNLIIRLYSQSRNKGVNWPDIDRDFLAIDIEFRNVSDFRASFTGFGLQQVSGFDIIDISKNGLEGINFEVEDYENDVIKFGCKAIEILSVSSPFKL